MKLGVPMYWFYDVFIFYLLKLILNIYECNDILIFKDYFMFLIGIQILEFFSL